MNPLPCRRCVAEALVTPTALGYKVICSAKPAEHSSGVYKSRDKAVRDWNERQKNDHD